jgi:hypothetical protein
MDITQQSVEDGTANTLRSFADHLTETLGGWPKFCEASL